MPSDDLDSIFIYLLFVVIVACFGLGFAWFLDKWDEIVRDEGGWWE